jgi:hypothetical protein
MSDKHSDDTPHDDDHGKGGDDPSTHDTGDNKGVDDSTTHDVGDDKGVDDPATHDVGDDKGVDDPATHDVGDDKGVDDPATHDVGDDKGVDDPATHDLGDDHGQHELALFLNQRTKQVIFSADATETEHWRGDDSKLSLSLPVATPAAGDSTVPVWRFHDAGSDVFFWTADSALKDSLVSQHPELSFDGEAFRAFDDGASGGHTAIGVVWDHAAGGAYGSFTYVPVDDAVRLAGVSSDDSLDYLGVAFWI